MTGKYIDSEELLKQVKGWPLNDACPSSWAGGQDFLEEGMHENVECYTRVHQLEISNKFP